MEKTKPRTIDEYIVGFPKDIQLILKQIRTTIKSIVPTAEETISYAIPTLTLKGIHLVFFAAFKKHIGFYATPTGHEEFNKELSQFKQGKGSVQFPLDKPIPYDLIIKIVKFRLKEILAKDKTKKDTTKKPTQNIKKNLR